LRKGELILAQVDSTTLLRTPGSADALASSGRLFAVATAAPLLRFSAELQGLTLAMPPASGAKLRRAPPAGGAAEGMSSVICATCFGLAALPEEFCSPSRSGSAPPTLPARAFFFLRSSWSWPCDFQFLVKQSWLQKKELRPYSMQVGQHNLVVASTRPHP